MARAIIRWSFSGEPSNVSGNAVRKRLRESGFDRTGTGSAEATDLSTASAIGGIEDALDVMLHPPGGGRLDHVWVYIDDAENN